jgi:protein-disulfide isomerase
MAMNTNAIGPSGPSDDELLAGVRRRMAGVESLVPLPGAWTEAGAGFGRPVQVGVRSRVRFAGLAPLVLVAVLVVVTVGYGMSSRSGAPTMPGGPLPAGMTRVIYQLVAPNGAAPTSAELDATVRVLSARLSHIVPMVVTADGNGSPLPALTTEGVVVLPPDRVAVEFPTTFPVTVSIAYSNLPLWDRQSLLDMLGRTGQVEFADLPSGTYGTVDAAGAKPLPTLGAPADAGLTVVLQNADIEPSQVGAVHGSNGASPLASWVDVGFTSAGRQKLTAYAANNAGHYLAVVVDGVAWATIPMAGNGQACSSGVCAVADGHLEISGAMSETDAEKLALLMQTGPLPLPIAMVETSDLQASTGPRAPQATPTPILAPTIVAPSALTPTDIPSSGRTLGSANATVTLDLWGDFQCSACGNFAAGTEPQLINNYVKQGKLKIVYHDFIVIDSMNGGHDSENAADAARIAADQGKFWIFSDYLWANQQNEQAGEFSRDRLIEIARLAGLDVARFTADLDAGKYLAEVRAESAMGPAAGYVGAPTVLVDGKPAGADGMVPDYATISAAIDRSLAAPSPSAAYSPPAQPSPTATPQTSASAPPTPVATFPGPADLASPSSTR